MNKLFVVLAVLFGALLGHVHAFKPHIHQRPEDFDKRHVGNAPALPEARAVAVARLKERVPNLKVELDDLLGAPKFVGSTEGFLTGPDGKGRAVSAAAGGNDPHGPVKAFLNEHAALYGHGAEVLADARTGRDYVTGHNGLRTVVWEQRVDGIPVFEAVLIAHITRRGELVNVSSQFLPAPARAAEAGLPNRAIERRSPRVTAQQAIANGALSLELGLAAADVTVAADAEGPELKSQFSAPGIRGNIRASLVWLPIKRDLLTLCWDVTFTEPAHGETFRFMVDTQSGEVLVRRCLTVYLSNASYRVFTSDSPTPFSPGHATPSSVQPAVVARTLVVTNAVNTNASPNGWIDDAINETRGNNVDAHLDRDANNSPDLPRPQGSPLRVFDFPLDLTQSPSTYGNAAAVQLFYWCNFMHDKLWELGFTEAAGNFQNNNFGRGGAANDALQADAQDGDGFNNANYTPTPDGTPPRIQMFIFNGPNPDRDGDFDSEIVIHEYTHGLSDRLVGGGVGISALQTAGMGEGWSDFYGLALLGEPGDDPAGNYAAGAYATSQFFGSTNNYYFGIRRYPYSTDMTKNPLTFKDIDPALASAHAGIPRSPIIGSAAAEVHNQGEVWCVTLWEARANLIAKHGFATGNQLILKLVTDGMKLAPVNPNFLQARDAIIQADQVLTGGANRAELWAAFVKRGMGFNAVSPSSSTTSGVIENFDPPDDLKITPLGSFVSVGSVGGPFTPPSRIFALRNIGGTAFQWSARSGSLVDLSVTSGALSPGANALVTASVNSAAVVLPAGVYSDTITFSNHSSGAVQERAVRLKIGQPDFFTELFESGDNNLDNQSFTFTPDGSSSFYSACRTTVSSFRTDPAGGTSVTLSDDSFTRVALTGGAQVRLYGVSYSEFFIGANGYITFQFGDSSFGGSALAHFAIPRIAALFVDLDPGSGGSISWRQLSNRVAVTYQNVPQFGTGNANSFQFELFFDGTVRVTYLGIAVTGGTAGLSRGGGVPQDFTESDFGSYGLCLPPLRVVVPEFASESSGTLFGQGTVSIPAPLAVDFTVTLTSSDITEASVDSTVTIAAGQTNAAFDVTVVDDVILDGTQGARITASAGGYRSADDTISIHDNESATLSVELPAAAREGDELLTRAGTVTVSAAPEKSVIVTLTATATDELIVPVPAAAVIPAGSTSGTFDVRIVEDLLIDGAQIAGVVAHVENWVDGLGNMTVLDNEPTDLRLTIPASVTEGDGILSNAGMAAIAGPLPTNLVVTLQSEDSSQVGLPSAVTITAGETWAVFNLNVGDDELIDGSHALTLTATAAGFTNGTASVTVVDNELPPEPYTPSPAHLATQVSTQADLSWGGGDGEQIVNGGFESGDLSGWTREITAGGDWVVNDGTFDPEGPDGAASPLQGAFSALAQQTGGGKRAIYQDILLPPGATFALLTWSHQIRNHALGFTSNQQFRVELRDTTNNVLDILFASGSADPLLGAWTNFTADLRAYRGRTVRIAFVEEDTGNYLNVLLDNVSVELGAPSLTAYQIYFGTNAIPGAPEHLGSTTNTTWPLPALARQTTYYWQIVAQRGAIQVPGPVWQFRTEGSTLPTSLVRAGSVWKYLDNGSDQGTAWREPNFDDSAWASGRAQLGYGDADEGTVVSYGTNASAKYITTYFRGYVEIPEPAAIPDLMVRLLRDDGGVVYLNGTEVFRSNLPDAPAPILFNTVASSHVNAPEESAYYSNLVDRTLLQPGTNVIAVEIHQASASSPDLSFDLQLTTSLPGSNLPPVVVITNPAGYATFRLPTNIIIQAAASDPDGTIRKVEFFSNATKVFEDSIAPYSFPWATATPGTHFLTAVVTDNEGEVIRSAPVPIIVSRPGPALATVVPAGSIWRYLDDGSNLGTTWRHPDYNDTAWQRGPAQLGYGDGDEATVVGYGPSSTAKFITTYFRQAFTNYAVFGNLRVSLLRDDGAVVYLNDTEVFRSNLPATPINYLTLATSASDDGTIFLTNNVNSALMRPGRNVLAVEIHQSSGASSDISFDLALTGTGQLPPAVTITQPATETTFPAPQDIPIAADAFDSYGQVVKVGFFRDNTLISEDFNAPFAATLENAAPGTFDLTAVATDNDGATTRSGPVRVTIAEPPALSLVRVGSVATLAWPASAGGFALQSATNLSPPIIWLAVTNEIQQAGGELTVDIDTSTGERYFRLSRP